MSLIRLGFILAIMVCVTITLTEIAEQMQRNKKPIPNYNAGTPAYDLMVLTNGKEMKLGDDQYAAVIGVEVMNLWLQNAVDKRIVSIVAVDRGILGSTSSFLIIYNYLN